VVSWDANEFYVDRFNGSVWQTIGTSETANVLSPYSYSAYVPSIAAVVAAESQLYLAWQVPSSDYSGSHILAARLTEVPSPTSEPVVWTAASGVAASGSDLTKTASTGWGGAVSTRAIAFGDGYVEIAASETTSNRMFGLSHGDTDQSYTDIDFAMYLTGNNLNVYERGGQRGGNFATFVPGDVLRVAVVGGRVKYSKNGVAFYTSTAAPSYPLLVDTALLNQGATLKSVVISGVLKGN
jgi:hypothetical protein